MAPRSLLVSDQSAFWHSDAARGPSAPSFDHLVGAASTSTLHVSCQRKYGPNNSVGCTGNKLRHDAQVDAKLRTKYRQDEKDTYQERQSVWLQPGERHCQSIWK